MIKTVERLFFENSNKENPASAPQTEKSFEEMWDFSGSLMSSLFQSLTENEVGNGCCLFNVEEDRTDAVGKWGVFIVPT